MPDHMGNVTVGRWFSERPYPRPPLKEKQVGVHQRMHIMSCIPLCKQLASCQQANTFWWRWPPASNLSQKPSCRRIPNRPPKLLNSGHRPNARTHGQCDCWEMILSKTLSKASSKRKTVLSASAHALHVMHASLQTAGLLPASKKTGSVLMALASCQQPKPKTKLQKESKPSFKIVKFLALRQRRQTHGKFDCWEMFLSKPPLLKENYSWPCPKPPPNRKHSSGCINSCTSYHAFRDANSGVCFDGFGFLPASLSQKPSGRRRPSRPSSFWNSGHRRNAAKHIGNVTVGRWLSQRPPYLKEATSLDLVQGLLKRKTVPGASTHGFMSSIPRCKLQGLFWWLWTSPANQL